MMQVAMEEQFQMFEASLPHTDDGMIDLQALSDEQHQQLQMY